MDPQNISPGQDIFSVPCNQPNTDGVISASGNPAATLPLPNYVNGRPREFDEAEVLDQALKHFWKHGYEATTMRDLQAATGLSSQSIYNSFGGKRGMLISVIDHYNYAYLQKLTDLIEQEKSPIEAVRIPIRFYRDKALEADCPGCFLANALVECGQDTEVARRCHGGFSLLRDTIASRLKEAQQAGYLSEHGTPEGIAAAIGNNLVGLATIACGPINQEEIAQIFEGMMVLLQSVVQQEHWQSQPPKASP
ncbi:MAG: TetR/AcrR family transcriptional regulator [Verrucomicrobiota bacterium]